MDLPGQFSAVGLLAELGGEAVAAKAYQSVFGQVMPRGVARRLGGGEEVFREAGIGFRYKDGRLGLLFADSLSKVGKDRRYHVERTFDLAERTVEHTLLKLAIDFQDQQIARRLLGAQMRLYQDWGIKRIDVTTGKDVGGYAWARYGFVPVHRQDFGREVLKRFKKVRKANGWDFEGSGLINASDDLLCGLERMDPEVERQIWLREKPQLLKDGWTREEIKAVYGETN